MQIKDLRQLYLAELQEARSFEDQIASTLSELADKAGDEELKTFLQEDGPEAGGHRDRVAELLDNHGVASGEHEDQAMRAILSEALKWAERIDTPAVRDAALVASAQRIQHYEIAVYGSLASWAKEEGLDDDLGVLLSILNEEKMADGKLTELAKGSLNAEAA